MRIFFHFLLPVWTILLGTPCLWADSRLGSVMNSNFQIADQPELKTWWYGEGEMEENRFTTVAADKVRRSTSYHVRVSLQSAPDELYDAFTYLSIPRNGMPADALNRPDGAEFAKSAGLTMSWSSFMYKKDAYVYVKRYQQTDLTLDQVTIKPRHLNLETAIIDSQTVRIKVPYREGGLRFSVEFAAELYWSYQKGGDGAGSLGLDGGARVHQEPIHSLLIFAEPFIEDKPSDLVPDPGARDVYQPEQGLINFKGLTETHSTIHFRPGVYYLPRQTHAYLPAHVKWIHLAPGAYVKGAFEFQGEHERYKVTGYGVLSGEDYEYEPDRRNSYQRTREAECHGSCVKMLQFKSSPFRQKLVIHGITLANPPYHSFVVYDEPMDFVMDVQSFKQVGAWYWQTDGLELYQGSSLKHAFIHSNDDVLKIYHGNLAIEDVVVWKGENGPVIQLGWTSRAMENVHVKDIDVIHNRMYWQDVKHNHCLINSARHYQQTWSDALANTQNTIRNILLENIRSEGMNLCAMRLFALSNWEYIHIKNLHIDAWNELPFAAQQSQFQRMRDPTGQKVSVGNERLHSRGLKIENYTVGGMRISKWDDSWRADQPGRLNFESELWDNWNAW